MGFFDSLFAKKPSKRDIVAFNYFLFFTYIPKQLKLWSEGKESIQTALSLPSSVIEKHPEWKSLNKKITVTTSTLKKCEDVTMYLIKAPTTEMMGEVICAMFGANPNLKAYEYFTMEFSLGNFAICTADEESNHYFMDNCSDAEQFGAYVIKQSMDSLIPKPKPAPKPEPKPAPKASTSSQQPSSPKNKADEPKVHTAESFLKVLEKIADDYYSQRGVVSLEDWMVTQKVGNQFKFYITQYPDAEFEDPNCEVTLMVDFMDHNGRMEVVNKFFPKSRTPSSENSTQADSSYPNALADSYYSLDQLRQIQMGELRLQPIDAGIIFNQQLQEIVAVFASKSPRIKKYLPNLDLSSPEAIAKYFSTFCQKTEMGLEFGYSLKMNKYGDVGVIGFIFVHTPGLNKMAINFPQWTIDFCLFEPLEGKAIMRTSILRVLDMLKNTLKVKNVFAIVDEDNDKCLRLMSNLPFDLTPEILTDPTTGNKAKLFRCNLETINFQRR